MFTRTAQKALVAIALILTSSLANAAYKYTYTGQAFQTNTLENSTNISVNFYTDFLLSANTRYDYLSKPFEYLSMSDGVNVIAVGGGSLLSSSFIQTDNSGSISQWIISELIGAGRSFVSGEACCTINDPPFMYTYNSNGATDASIQTNGFFQSGGTGYAYNNQLAGNWAVTPVPEPETYAMMLMGIGMLGFMARRQRVIKSN